MSAKNAVERQVTDAAQRLEEAARRAGPGVAAALEQVAHRVDEAAQQTRLERATTRAPIGAGAGVLATLEDGAVAKTASDVVEHPTP